METIRASGFVPPGRIPLESGEVKAVQFSSTRDAKFRQVFDAYFEALSRYCLRRISESEVNDVVAEVFAVAWRKVDRMPDGENALPWLYGVARNEIRNRHRSNRRLLALTDKIGGQANHPDLGPEPIVVRKAQLDELMSALASLRPEDQELLLLRTHEELDLAQIAIVIGSSPEAARKRLTRAISRLRLAAGIPEPQQAVSESRATEKGGDQ